MIKWFASLLRRIVGRIEVHMPLFKKALGVNTSYKLFLLTEIFSEIVAAKAHGFLEDPPRDEWQSLLQTIKK
jgi:hypothetical protein